MPEPTRGAEFSNAPYPLGKHPQEKSGLFRIIVPLLFLIATGAIVYGVLTLLKNQAPPPSTNKITPPTPIHKNVSPTKSPVNPGSEIVPTLPVPEPELPLIIEPAPTLPDGMEAANPGMEAMEVLEKFLTAKTLDERRPLIETQTPEEELFYSSLNGALPTTSKIEIDSQESNAMEQVTDYYHSVDFVVDGQPINPQTILVRTRGSGDPKVVVDPFLDTFGGRLAKYASTPTDKAGIFQVTVSAVASCNDENVPNREKKLTLKLLPRDNTKEIARAYFGRQSKIGEMLEDGTYSLSYGKAKACTVMLRWNSEDSPGSPYLEALTLKSLDWNP